MVSFTRPKPVPVSRSERQPTTSAVRGCELRRQPAPVKSWRYFSSACYPPRVSIWFRRPFGRHLRRISARSASKSAITSATERPCRALVSGRAPDNRSDGAPTGPTLIGPLHALISGGRCNRQSAPGRIPAPQRSHLHADQLPPLRVAAAPILARRACQSAATAPALGGATKGRKK